jgi:hypothetical protein
MTPRHFFGEICEQRYADQQICRAVASATRVNQGVGPWVLQQPLASPCLLVFGLLRPQTLENIGGTVLFREVVVTQYLIGK